MAINSAKSAATARVAPHRLPIIGHALALAGDPLRFLRTVQESGDLVRVDIGALPVYFVTTPELFHQVLVKDAHKFARGRFFTKTRRLLGDGLATSDGEEHRRQRRLMQPVFHKSRMADYASIMSKRVHDLTDSWHPGQELQVEKEMMGIAIEVITETMFSYEFGPHTAAEIRRCMSALDSTIVARAVMPKLFDHIPIPVNRRFDNAADRMRRITDEVVAHHRAHRPGDLLSWLLSERDPETGEAMDDLHVRDEVTTILGAGSVTTANTMSWVFHELARHPAVERKVHAEVDEVIGGRPVSYTDMPNLTYTSRLIQEVQRLYSPPLGTRRAIAPVELAGVRIQPGTEVAFSLYAMHRDPRLYVEPDRLDPDRWLPERSRQLPPGAFIPFAAGHHRCIGEAFSKTEMLLVIAAITSRWRLRPVPGHTTRAITALVPRPDALPMTVEARN